MATSRASLEFLLDQLSGLSGVRAKAMFGEYGLYVDDVLVGLVCDDQLYLKPTDGLRQVWPEAPLAPPYPGARAHARVTADRWEDAEWLVTMVQTTAQHLPPPRPRRR
ncbi:TfoX/Sxy family protein [Oleiagrimonas sp. C23AA]|uniref:TfoX/Sxy family protein n=1 Tax=Oleiagrimonas sp. C23AA TaxID=2719047 RepID=UPI0014213444|nr:TfoX/Sxy family protein [Oleiagrimonas sp. C23AA]NII10166.1 TfoX/Sxy family protein [Oleiagrimonas sp. C23AA]